MNHLYNIAIDPKVPLEDRYAVLRIMKVVQVNAPRDYRKMQQKADRQRKYNEIRGDFRTSKQA
ncbi:hypothetical protein LOZ80_37990 [Paenibacillus sp. HWE-109]|uniref:hypothetical protein n=1 Tax=Paenibacillus sp. HWE-109 TaxID=1306526 RepID=UPI001EDD9ADB|nr:hypothetical protein [Paenibacillus sp. HWE-109]UKS27184.1 hypothetical protein LOZ80_37990 [Paenibacillus sp. HWE-109]